MPDTIQIRGGVKSKLPTLLAREPGYCTDTEELYIGTGANNKLVGSVASAAGRFPAVSITQQTPAASAANGTIFEDTDGALKYKNLAGLVTTL